MSILVSTLISAVEHRIGGPVSSKFTDTKTVVNRAGRIFYAMHPWQMALVVPATLDFVAGDDTASLPFDFAALVGVARSDGSFIRRCTPQELNDLRNRDQGAEGTVDAVAVLSLSTLGLWRTPTASSTDALSIAYRARWADKDSVTDEVAVSDFAEPLLIEVCREYAAGLEGGDWPARYEAIKRSAFFMDIATQDGGSQLILSDGFAGGSLMNTDWIEHTTWGLS